MSLFESALKAELEERKARCKADGVPFTATLFESAFMMDMNECRVCCGTGWIGHGMGGDT